MKSEATTHTHALVTAIRRQLLLAVQEPRRCNPSAVCFSFETTDRAQCLQISRRSPPRSPPVKAAVQPSHFKHPVSRTSLLLQAAQPALYTINADEELKLPLTSLCLRHVPRKEETRSSPSAYGQHEHKILLHATLACGNDKAVLERLSQSLHLLANEAIVRRDRTASLSPSWEQQESPKSLSQSWQAFDAGNPKATSHTLVAASPWKRISSVETKLSTQAPKPSISKKSTESQFTLPGESPQDDSSEYYSGLSQGSITSEDES